MFILLSNAASCGQFVLLKEMNKQTYKKKICLPNIPKIGGTPPRGSTDGMNILNVSQYIVQYCKDW